MGDSGRAANWASHPGSKSCEFGITGRCLTAEYIGRNGVGILGCQNGTTIDCTLVDIILNIGVGNANILYWRIILCILVFIRALGWSGDDTPAYLRIWLGQPPHRPDSGSNG